MIKELLLKNYLIFTPLFAYLIAQVLKTILYSVMSRKFDYKRLLGSGGMPSSHAATVVALATASLKKLGALSPITAVTFVLATIVIYDARGVRQEVGKHAQILSKIYKNWHGESDQDNAIKLDEMVGHTPFQVVIGGVIGMVTAFCIPAI